ncbi:MAG: carbonic anhydrase family protein [Hydrogenothermaceae bacterium]|nr:carbonic anhydrase family protein [Hydrogenothermaceae bacterium]
MVKKLFLSSLLVISTAVFAQDKHWSYEGETGPEHWADLAPENFWCKLKNQSPVDISNTVEGQNPKLEISYKKEEDYKIINNGHTLQVNVPPANFVSLNGKAYQLIQFHFHSPSEHTIKGKNYPMELHLVHKSDKGELLVIGVMIKEGPSNGILREIFNQAPVEEGEKELKLPFNIYSLLPKNRDYYLYSGSLTTPPCTEGVTWIVLKTPITASKDEIEKFRTIMKHPNNRPIQPLNSRFILK